MRNPSDLNKYIYDDEFDHDHEFDAFLERLENDNTFCEDIKKENFALGLPITYLLNGELVSEYSDGKLEFFTYVDGEYTVLRTEKKIAP